MRPSEGPPTPGQPRVPISFGSLNEAISEEGRELPVSSRPQDILLLEDDEGHAEIVRRAFQAENPQAKLSLATTIAEAAGLIDRIDFDLVISDWRLPDGEGIELLGRAPRVPFLIMTSFGNEQLAVGAMKAGAVDYVVKSEASLLAMPRIAERALRMWDSEVAREKLRAAEEKLVARNREEDWFRKLFEGASHAMILVDSEDLIRLVNSQTERIFGYSRDELLGEPVSILVPPHLRQNRPAGSAGLLAALQDDSVTRALELYGSRRDGLAVPIEMGVSFIETAEGPFTLASVVDITQRKQAQEGLANFRRRFRRLLDASPVGIVETNWEGTVYRANPSFYRMIGWDAAEFAAAGMDLLRITPDDFKPISEARLGEIRESRRSTQYEKEYLRKDGSRLPALIGVSVSDADPDDIIAFILDLSEQKAAERRLRESERELSMLADAMPQIVWTSDPSGNAQYFNRRWREVTGSRATGGPETWQEILHPDDFQNFRDAWTCSLDSGCDYETQFRLWDRNWESFRWQLARAVPLRDDSGEIVKWVGTSTDIDEHKRLSEDLEGRVAARTSELESSLLEKTTLLQEVHHRVKNNLQVVCSLLSMQVRSSERDLAGPLETAHQRVLAMSLIHEQLYKSETLSDVNFGAYVETLCYQLLRAYSVDSGRIRLELNLESIALPIGDAIPCGLILNELFSNTLKHAFRDGSPGVIGVSFTRAGESLELVVSDNGVGLPEDFQVAESRSLGLKVVQTLARQLRAELKIHRGGAQGTTDSSKGTEFVLSWKTE